jgi:hypothetical protein
MGYPRIVGASDKLFQIRDLTGQFVFIQKGEFKGLKALVLFADEVKFRLEIMARHQIVTLAAEPGLISEPLKDSSAALGVEQNEENPASFDETGQLIQVAEDHNTEDGRNNCARSNSNQSSHGTWGVSPAYSMSSGTMSHR